MPADSSLQDPRPPSTGRRIARAPAPQKAKDPPAAATPRSAAALAPGKAIIESVCPAKVSRRRIITHPTTPAITATMPAARRALIMKWYSSSWPTSRTRFQLSWGLAPSAGMSVAVGMGVLVAVVMVGRGLGLADHDQAPVGGPQHLDANPVEAAQRLACDHLLDRSLERVPAREGDHPVDRKS